MSVHQGIATIPNEAPPLPVRAWISALRRAFSRDQLRPAVVDVKAINRTRQESYDDFIRRLDELLYEDEGLESARARGIRPTSSPRY